MKRESYYVEISQIIQTNWVPSPREYSTLVSNDQNLYLIGGLNYEMNNEIAKLTVIYNKNYK